MPINGSEKVKHFYDSCGWKTKEGKLVDQDMFGSTEIGPIRQRLQELHVNRIRSALQQAGDAIDLLECGCGGNPATFLLDLCVKYTGVDFSATGLEKADETLRRATTPYELCRADACQLPFEDGQFDAVFSAHMLYHIPNAEGQRAALHEMLRVLKPNGVLVLITANPRPLLFPIRLFKRVIADTPMLGRAANALRSAPVLPYQPMRLAWLQRQFSPYGSVEFVAHELPSTAFNRGITEQQGLGRILWRLILWLDVAYPHASAFLGNYAQVTVLKTAHESKV